MIAFLFSLSFIGQAESLAQTHDKMEELAHHQKVAGFTSGISGATSFLVSTISFGLWLANPRGQSGDPGLLPVMEGLGFASLGLAFSGIGAAWHSANLSRTLDAERFKDRNFGGFWIGMGIGASVLAGLTGFLAGGLLAFGVWLAVVPEDRFASYGMLHFGSLVAIAGIGGLIAGIHLILDGASMYAGETKRGSASGNLTFEFTGAGVAWRW